MDKYACSCDCMGGVDWTQGVSMCITFRNVECMKGPGS